MERFRACLPSSSHQFGGNAVFPYGAQQLKFLQLTPRRSVWSNSCQVCPSSVLKSLPVRPTATAVSPTKAMLGRKPAGDPT